MYPTLLKIAFSPSKWYLAQWYLAQYMAQESNMFSFFSLEDIKYHMNLNSL